MNAFFAGLGRFSVRFRWALLVGWIVVTVFSVKAFPSLASVAKDTTSGRTSSRQPDRVPCVP